MKVFVLNVNKVIFEDDADNVVLPGRDGEFGVLDLHEDFLYRLRKGIVKINNAFSLSIEDGVARMQNNKLVVLVEL